MIEYRKYIEGEVTSHTVGEYGGKSITVNMRDKMVAHIDIDTPRENPNVNIVDNLALDSMIETGVLWTKGAVAGRSSFAGYSRLGAHKRVLPLIPGLANQYIQSFEIVMPTLEIITSGSNTHGILMVNTETNERTSNSFLTNVYPSELRLNLPNGRQPVYGSVLCLGMTLKRKAAQEVPKPRYGQLGLLNDLLSSDPNDDLDVILKIDTDKLAEYLETLLRDGVITPENAKEMVDEGFSILNEMPRLNSPECYHDTIIHYEVSLLTLHLLGKYLPFNVAANAPFHIMESLGRTKPSDDVINVMSDVVEEYTQSILDER